jgi:hypothetical protein
MEHSRAINHLFQESKRSGMLFAFTILGTLYPIATRDQLWAHQAGRYLADMTCA